MKMIDQITIYHFGSSSWATINDIMIKDEAERLYRLWFHGHLDSLFWGVTFTLLRELEMIHEEVVI